MATSVFTLSVTGSIILNREEVWLFWVGCWGQMEGKTGGQIAAPEATQKTDCTVSIHSACIFKGQSKRFWHIRCGVWGKRKKDASLSLKIYGLETSLVVLWLRLYTSTAGDVGWVPGRGTKIPPAVQCGQKFSFKKDFVLSHQKKMDLPSTEEKAEGATALGETRKAVWVEFDVSTRQWRHRSKSDIWVRRWREKSELKIEAWNL